MGEVARARIADEYSIRAVAASYRSLYASVAEAAG